MSNNAQASSSTSIGFTGALFLVFLVLKLTKVINWSWWWVTSPIWIPILIALIIIGVVFYIEYKDKKKARSLSRRRN
jgi:hypothetical protein